MRPYLLRSLILILIIYVGYNSVKQQFGGYDIGLLGFLGNVTFLLLIVITIVAFVVEFKNHDKSKRRFQYVVTFFGLIFCSIVFFKILKRESVDTAATVLKIKNLPGANNTINFEFKERANFKLIEYNRLGEDIYYGKYSKTGDTIKIEESNYTGFANKLPEFGIIRNDTMFWNKFDTMLVEREIK